MLNVHLMLIGCKARFVYYLTTENNFSTIQKSHEEVTR